MHAHAHHPPAPARRPVKHYEEGSRGWQLAELRRRLMRERGCNLIEAMKIAREEKLWPPA